MFFILSKLIKCAITPLMWVIILLFFAVTTRDYFKRKKYLFWGFGLLLFFSTPLVFNVSMNLWEIPYTQYKDLKTYDVGIVMGGVIAYNGDMDRLQFLRGADRLFQAIDLYKTGKVKKIIFTGGSGYVIHTEFKEAALVKKYVLKLGIPDKDFLIETESRNTHENAVFTKKLLDKEQLNGSLLLITSAFHMRRSLACFHKLNIFPQPYCTDKYGKDEDLSYNIGNIGLLIPSISPLLDWTNFIHELVGYLIYKVVGYA